MNELSEIFKAVQDGECITLENKIYEIAPEDSFHLKGFFFSNTAKYEENPDGERFCAIYLDGKRNITIDGNGAKVMIHGKMTPFIFCNCRNIVMKNICFDHYRPTMSEFTVADSADGYAEIHIADEFIYRTDGNMLYWRSENNQNNEPYWEIPYKGRGVLTNAFNPSRAILCTTRKDVVIRNNVFRNMGAAALCVADDANFWFESGRSGKITFENNTVINCAARYSAFGDDVIRYEPVVMDKSSAAPVHQKLILRNNRFIRGTGRKYTVNLSYLGEAVIEGNSSDVELEVLNYRK